MDVLCTLKTCGICLNICGENTPGFWNSLGWVLILENSKLLEVYMQIHEDRSTYPANIYLFKVTTAT